jgi:hypothetical protein
MWGQLAIFSNMFEIFLRQLPGCRISKRFHDHGEATASGRKIKSWFRNQIPPRSPAGAGQLLASARPRSLCRMSAIRERVRFFSLR